MEVLVDRCAGLDVHKKTITACVRIPDQAGVRVQQTRTFDTFLDGLVALRDWLVGEGVTQVAMEATGSYWKPVWYVLEELDAVELLLCNARHVKQVPGRQDRRQRRPVAVSAARSGFVAVVVGAAAGDPSTA